jgi:hypothetical protein
LRFGVGVEWAGVLGSVQGIDPIGYQHSSSRKIHRVFLSSPPHPDADFAKRVAFGASGRSSHMDLFISQLFGFKLVRTFRFLSGYRSHSNSDPFIADGYSLMGMTARALCCFQTRNTVAHGSLIIWSS